MDWLRSRRDHFLFSSSIPHVSPNFFMTFPANSLPPTPKEMAKAIASAAMIRINAVFTISLAMPSSFNTDTDGIDSDLADQRQNGVVILQKRPACQTVTDIACKQDQCGCQYVRHIADNGAPDFRKHIQMQDTEAFHNEEYYHDKMYGPSDHFG